MSSTPDFSQFNTKTNNELEKAEDRASKKGGRKPKSQELLFTERVASKLTKEQKEQFTIALDGRAEATKIRDLILAFIEENK